MRDTCFELCAPGGLVRVRLDLATVPVPRQPQALATASERATLPMLEATT